MKKEKNYVSIHDHYERRKKLCIVPVSIFQNTLENTSKKKKTKCTGNKKIFTC